jgi:hypothetical protein
MKWMLERDALIAQTMAFVQSVTGRREDFPQPDTAPAMPAAIEASPFAAIGQPPDVKEPPRLVEPLQPMPQVLPPRTSGDFRSEIQARVANFRKHQERFEREREEYCTTTLARLRDAIRKTPPRPPAGK